MLGGSRSHADGSHWIPRPAVIRDHGGLSRRWASLMAHLPVGRHGWDEGNVEHIGELYPTVAAGAAALFDPGTNGCATDRGARLRECDCTRCRSYRRRLGELTGGLLG
jgi:hypothetical protein